MGKSIYFECSTGVSGDMIVASLLDLGADKDVLQTALDSIPAHGFKTEISRVQKSGIDCADFNVILDEAHENHDHDMEYLYGHSHEHEHEHHHEHEEHHHHDHEHEHGHHHHEHRGLAEIQQIIGQTKMTENARALALKIFDIVATAESKAHNLPKEQVHFHEVGALDSIIDIICAAVCFDNLGVQKVYLPQIAEGSGTVRCQHGVLPVPVPAVVNIAAAHSLPLKITDLPGERITPTGAAFLAAVATDKKLPETFSIVKTGMGAGKRAYEVPSIVRAYQIEEAASMPSCCGTPSAASMPSGCGTPAASTSPGCPEEAADDTIWKLETNVDDSTGESLGYAMERLFVAGARDVSFVPCYMKKNRPGTLINVICTKEKIPELEKILFEETTTIGIRRVQMQRSCLPRKNILVETKYGSCTAKAVTLPDGKERMYPEYEDVKNLAQKNNVPLAEVFDQVKKNSL